MRLIDADALKLAICRDQCEKDGCDYTCSDIAYVVNAPTVGGWISVKDRMPPNDDTKVMTYGNPVTHWMSLPEPPKEK